MLTLYYSFEYSEAEPINDVGGDSLIQIIDIRRKTEESWDIGTQAVAELVPD